MRKPTAVMAALAVISSTLLVGITPARGQHARHGGGHAGGSHAGGNHAVSGRPVGGPIVSGNAVGGRVAGGSVAGNHAAAGQFAGHTGGRGYIGGPGLGGLVSGATVFPAGGYANYRNPGIYGAGGISRQTYPLYTGGLGAPAYGGYLPPYGYGWPFAYAYGASDPDFGVGDNDPMFANYPAPTDGNGDFALPHDAPPSGTAPPVRDDAAHLQLILPDNAEVFVDGVRTIQTGTVRQYHSPQLTAGKRYRYRFLVRYVNARGDLVDDARDIRFQANDWFRIDFTRPPPASAPTPRPAS